MRVYKGNAFTLALSLAFYSKPEYLSVHNKKGQMLFAVVVLIYFSSLSLLHLQVVKSQEMDSNP